MNNMFEQCKKFNCDLSKWNTSKVEYMTKMFCRCINFDGKGLENWDVSKVVDFDKMFLYCENIDVDLNNWKVSRDATKRHMFSKCTSLIKTPDWY